MDGEGCVACGTRPPPKGLNGFALPAAAPETVLALLNKEKRSRAKQMARERADPSLLSLSLSLSGVPLVLGKARRVNTINCRLLKIRGAKKKKN